MCGLSMLLVEEGFDLLKFVVAKPKWRCSHHTTHLIGPPPPDRRNASATRAVCYHVPYQGKVRRFMMRDRRAT